MINLSSCIRVLYIKSTLFLFFAFSHFILNAQKYDRNWCFGLNAGISFQYIDSVYAFQCSTYTARANASFSDKDGNLLFYLSYDTWLHPHTVDIRDHHHKVISDGFDINTRHTNTQGPIILPKPENDSIFYIFHLSPAPQVPSDLCQVRCRQLYHTKVKLKGDGLLAVESKNELMTHENFAGNLAAVQHANGKDWWLLLHGSRRKYNEPCNDIYWRFLITANGIQGPWKQHIGTPYCQGFDGAGVMKFSKSGNRFAVTVYASNIIDLYRFNRCTGVFSDFNYFSITGDFYPYGLEFSQNEYFLYITTGKEGGGGSELYQYNLKDIPIKQTIWSLLGVDETYMGQLKLASDGKIYMAKTYPASFYNLTLNEFNQTLGVIHSPDSLGLSCDFDPYGFQLHEKTRSNVGLPNMPNYNLGSLSIFKGSAGGDTVTICSEVPHKGILIGSPEVQGVQYNWYPSAGLDDDTLAEPVALPEVSTWYYLTLTDTTITNACQSRTDSIFVEVKDCSDTLVSVMPYVDEEKFDYRLHPNLLKDGKLFTGITIPKAESGYIHLYSIEGNKVGSYRITEGYNQLNLDRKQIVSGIYFYSVWINGEPKHHDKLVIIR